MKQQVAVIGLGRFGTNVVESLYNLGHDVLAIDKREDRVQSVMNQATYALAADATNETVYRELGIPDYDAAVVAIGSDIVPSIMASVLLKDIGVPYVVSRAYNQLHGNTLQRIGVDKVIHAEAEMGVRLAGTGVRPQAMFTSTAVRAATTAEIIAEAIGFPQGKIVRELGLYHTDVEDWLTWITGLDNAWNTVMAFGHNPGITELVADVWELPTE